MRCPGPSDECILVSGASRVLRRDLRPLVWVTLEEVALDVVVERGRLVSRTSARLIAERLGVDPVSAAGALRDLRRRGLLVLDGRQADRFGLSAYVLGPVPGLSVLPPGWRVSRPGREPFELGRGSS